jgi:uncharacterized membrane protein
METILRPSQEPVTRKNGFSAEEKAELDAPEVWPELDALLEKIQGLSQTNRQLRELVAQMSALVIRNVVERKS